MEAFNEFFLAKRMLAGGVPTDPPSIHALKQLKFLEAHKLHKDTAENREGCLYAKNFLTAYVIGRRRSYSPDA